MRKWLVMKMFAGVVVTGVTRFAKEALAKAAKTLPEI
jgi:hypothetical protein